MSRVLLCGALVSGHVLAEELPVPATDVPAPTSGDAATISPVATDNVAPAPTDTAPLVVPAGTELVFEMVDSVNSKTSKRGDRFALRLAEPLVINGHVLIPAGTFAKGEVVHADRAKAGGQAGELILAARTMDWGDRQLALRSFKGGIGRDRGNTAMGVAVAAGLAGFLVRGGEIEMSAGNLISAKLRDAVTLPAMPEAVPTATPATPETPATSATPASNNNTPGETEE